MPGRNGKSSSYYKPDMSNSYFQFKQFTIQQNKCVLKVSTDSCLFGGWIASKLQAINNKPQNILDIGAGTGLLMLMLAQKINATIDGIEIDKSAYQQAQQNIDASFWSIRLNLFHADVKSFMFSQQYDFIISNPPFFEGDLKSVYGNKNIAKHDEGLTLDDLLEIVNKHLSVNGTFAVLLPYHRTEYFLNLAEQRKLYCTYLLNVRQTPKHNYFRSILMFNRNQSTTKMEEMVIKESDDKYSTAFTELLKDYYLYL